jgi:Superfamily II DNA/RNA helicases, SNF2 family
MVVVDEAHRIKNSEGVWGQAAIEIAKEANSRVILTGTPFPNGYEDLYNLIRFIYPYKFREIMRTNNAQLKEMTKSNLSIQNDRVNIFVENIKPFFIRVKEKELKLPDPKEEIVKVSMDGIQRKIYDFVFSKFKPYFQDNQSATVKDVLTRARILRLRQAATNPALLLKPIIENMEMSKDGDGYDLNIIYENVTMEFDDSELVEDIIRFQETATPQKFVKTKEIYENKIMPYGAKVIVWTIFLQNAFELKKYLSVSGIDA